MSVNTRSGDWALEVVRGADPGRRFALKPGLLVLGRGPADRGGIDLSGQEGATLRPMEARHASIDVADRGLILRDLESPGGTFVNRRRILAGQAVTLRPDDVVQIGSVQLRLVGPSDRPDLEAAPGPVASAFPYALPDGSRVRSWDDFLTLSAQRWASIREELTSGRLATFLRALGRPDLIPRDTPGASADDRLDAWLGALPTTRPGLPEIDVHPARLLVRAAPGGGTIRRAVQVSNVGYRILRSTARIEPPGLDWLKLSPDAPTGTFATVEETGLAIEITVPDALPRQLRGELVIEGNGGTRRVVVVLEPRGTAGDPLEIGGEPGPASVPGDSRLLALIGRQSIPARLASWPLIAVSIRLLVGIGSGSIGEDGMTPSGPDAPSLARVGIVFAVGGAILGGWAARRRGGNVEIPTGGLAGACSGLVVASALVAACRAAEPLLGSWSASIPAACLLWAAFGAVMAVGSIRIAPRESS